MVDRNVNFVLSVIPENLKRLLLKHTNASVKSSSYINFGLSALEKMNRNFQHTPKSQTSQDFQWKETRIVSIVLFRCLIACTAYFFLLCLSKRNELKNRTFCATNWYWCFAKFHQWAFHYLMDTLLCDSFMFH